MRGILIRARLGASNGLNALFSTVWGDSSRALRAGPCATKGLRLRARERTRVPSPGFHFSNLTFQVCLYVTHSKGVVEHVGTLLLGPISAVL